MYEKLVDNPDDIVGQLAYCMYKQSKQQYLQQFIARNNRRPSDAEVSTHVYCAELPAVGMYKSTANNLFNDYLAQAIEDKLNEMEKRYKAELWLFIKRHKPESKFEQFLHGSKALFLGGIGGVVGNALTTLIVILLLFGAASSVTRDDFAQSTKERIISGLAETFGVDISIKPAPKGESPIKSIPETPAAPAN
ncbi:hypothetical protein N0725_04930 [Pseudomonas aeruginosa]|uniref:hypothetical protein n=1 Tax=Pseudomonas aeruginosa TaxID=287 RepID=UPI00044D4A56|nr:hypothetical protein [Pseudomonas aeruginosa]ELK3486122.1 hypothetical protein [Pseudomonas aeruginosa]EME9750177.1 hypothetical protein [Pseudomonas aeruginosa]ETU74234.1 hypothetical protein Q095_04686 [Pseudomonas aeruginosa PS50]MBG4583273.1 hypothetical protein [Pseudomonas aeruginosa]MBH9070839.1 hypothetical protein [Pseudomonas aeruginosa]